MKKPSGVDLMAILIDLLADQEGVTIRFTIESATVVQDAKK